MDETTEADIARDIKVGLWGEPDAESEMFYDKFSPVTGEVVAGWNFEKFCLDRMAGCRHTSTINAHTKTHP